MAVQAAAAGETPMLTRWPALSDHTSVRTVSVTDVERQPFRSMGFVSVIIVSGIFALGLLFVLF